MGVQLAGLLAGTLLPKVMDVVRAVQERRMSEVQARAEVETLMIRTGQEIARAGADVIQSELATQSWLTRNWRPSLMFLGMGLIVLFGVALPVVNLFTAAPLNFRPLWHEIPDGIWELLKWGIGGYVGGRTVEKVATQLARRPASGGTFPSLLGRKDDWPQPRGGI